MAKVLAQKKQKRAMKKLASIWWDGQYAEQRLDEGLEEKYLDNTIKGLSDRNAYYIKLYLDEIWSVLTAVLPQVDTDTKARIERLMEGLKDA